MDPRLLEYIKKCLSRGLAPQQIRYELIKAGWESKQIGDAMDLAMDASLDNKPFILEGKAPLSNPELGAKSNVKENSTGFSLWTFIKSSGFRFRVAAFLIFAVAGLILVLFSFQGGLLKNIKVNNLPFVKKEPTITKIADYNSKEDGNIISYSPKRTKIVTDKRIIGCDDCPNNPSPEYVVFDNNDNVILAKNLGSGGRIYELTSSKDNKHFAYVEDKKSSLSVFLDNKEVSRINIQPNELSFIDNLTISQDGSSVAFTFRTNNSGVVYINNKVGKPYSHLDIPTVGATLITNLSPDGKHIGYRAEGQGWGGTFVVDDKEFPLSGRSLIETIEEVNGGYGPFGPDLMSWTGSSRDPFERYINFSPDSKRYAFRGINRPDNGEWDDFLIIDGIEQRFGSVIGPVFSKDSKSVAYYAKEKSENVYNGKFVIEKGGSKKSIDSAGYYIFGLTFTNKNDLAYLAKDLEQSFVEGGTSSYFVVFGDKQSQKYGLIYNLQFNSDKSRYAFSAMSKEDTTSKVYKNKLIIDGQEVDEQVIGFQFSPDGRHYAYYKTDNPELTRSGKPDYQSYLVLDGKKYVFDGCSLKSPFVFNEDSNEVRYNVIKDNAIYLVTIPTGYRADQNKPTGSQSASPINTDCQLPTSGDLDQSLNVANQFAQANNTQRASDVNSILNVIHQFAVVNKGQLPGGIDANVRDITDNGEVNTINLCRDLVPKYIVDLPLDPTSGTESPTSSVCIDNEAHYDTKYTVVLDTESNKVTVASPYAELGAIISVTR